MSTIEEVKLNIVTIFGLSVQVNVPKNLSITIEELKRKITDKIHSKIQFYPRVVCFNNQQTNNFQTLNGTWILMCEFEFEV